MTNQVFAMLQGILGEKGGKDTSMHNCSSPQSATSPLLETGKPPSWGTVICEEASTSSLASYAPVSTCVVI